MYFSYNENRFYIYEIYPESSSPQLTQIAYTRIPSLHFKIFYSLSYDRLIFINGHVLTVWDYKANTWARWGVEDDHLSHIVTTKSAVILIRGYSVSVWEIPLLPESSLSMSTRPPLTPPAFHLDYPEDQLYDHLQTPCDWYSVLLSPFTMM